MLGKILIGIGLLVALLILFIIYFFYRMIDEWVNPTLPGNRGEEEHEAYLRKQRIEPPPDE